MQRCGQDPPPWDRTRTAKGQATQQIRLKELDVAHVIDFPRVGSQRLGSGSGDAQVEGLFAVGGIASRHVAADDQGKVVRAQPLLHRFQFNALLREHLRFNIGRGSGLRLRNGPRPDFHSLQLPQRIGMRDSRGMGPVAHHISQAWSHILIGGPCGAAFDQFH